LARREPQILGDYDRPETMPENSTWYVMTEIPGLNYKDVGIYMAVGVEYGLNQSKMNWDGQISLTQYQDIEKWWEIVCSAYLLVSLFADLKRNLENATKDFGSKVREHLEEQWDEGTGWKNWLNNLRLISLPFLCFNLILPWLKVFPIPHYPWDFLGLLL